MDRLTAIILAAGKGTRMKSTDTNKVALKIHGKPMLARTIQILRSAGIDSIVVVVGFAKESVTSLLDDKIIVAEQTEQLGTGHAVVSSLSKVPIDKESVLIIYGDDSFLYSPSIFQQLCKTHVEHNAKVTFITMDSTTPYGFGRIVRDGAGEVVGIVEEKNATEEQKKISEINLGCYVIDKKYLEENIKDINKNSVTGEYYITDIIDIIAHHRGKIAAYKLRDARWHGVNTVQDLSEAESLFADEE